MQLTIDFFSLFAGLITGILLVIGISLRRFFQLRSRIEQLELIEATTKETEAARVLATDQVMDLRQRLAAEEARTAERMATLEDAERRLRETEAAWTVATDQVMDLRQRIAAGEARAAERIATLEDAERRLTDSFRSLSAEAIGTAHSRLTEVARDLIERTELVARNDMDRRESTLKSLVQPVREQMTRLDEQIRVMEQARAGAYEGLKEQVLLLGRAQDSLARETQGLTRALRSPHVRGRWGEVQLRRVVELAGMLDHCDFYEQRTAEGEKQQRPDMVVRLPGGKSVVIDAKTPLEAYLDAVAAQDEEARRAAIGRHARQVRQHLKSLGEKEYWKQFEPAPEFVVLFLPGESFFSAALEADPQLIEAGMTSGVVLATPTTLIALLRAVAYGWKQERLEENARRIASLGAELHKRMAAFVEHLEKLGNHLNKTVESYNSAIGSLETRALVTARQLAEIDKGISDGSLPHPKLIETTARPGLSSTLATASRDNATIA